MLSPLLLCTGSSLLDEWLSFMADETVMQRVPFQVAVWTKLRPDWYAMVPVAIGKPSENGQRDLSKIIVTQWKWCRRFHFSQHMYAHKVSQPQCGVMRRSRSNLIAVYRCVVSISTQSHRSRVAGALLPHVSCIATVSAAIVGHIGVGNIHEQFDKLNSNSWCHWYLLTVLCFHCRPLLKKMTYSQLAATGKHSRSLSHNVITVVMYNCWLSWCACWTAQFWVQITGAGCSFREVLVCNHAVRACVRPCACVCLCAFAILFPVTMTCQIDPRDLGVQGTDWYWHQCEWYLRVKAISTRTCVCVRAGARVRARVCMGGS